MTKDYPEFICFDCGKKYGNNPDSNHICTVHEGICWICGQKKPVTEPRDFGHLKREWAK